MNSRATTYGLSSNCFDKIAASWNIGAPIPTTLPDGRTDRKLASFGVSGHPMAMRQVGVKPLDSPNVAFMSIRMHGYRDAPGNWKQERKKMMTEAAMQVRICKDGSVKGKTSTNNEWNPGSKWHPDDVHTYDNQRTVTSYMCQGGSNQLSYAAMDASFRDAVALARFALAQKRQGVICRLHHVV